MLTRGFTPHDITAMAKSDRDDSGFTPGSVATMFRGDSDSRPERPCVQVDLSGLVDLFDLGMRWHRQRRLDQRQLCQAIMRLAGQYQGVLSVADLVGHLSLSRREAFNQLEQARAHGVCHLLAENEGEPLYLFVGLLPAYHYCEYCASNFEHDHQARCCTNCGAALTVKRRI